MTRPRKILHWAVFVVGVVSLAAAIVYAILWLLSLFEALGTGGSLNWPSNIFLLIAVVAIGATPLLAGLAVMNNRKSLSWIVLVIGAITLPAAVVYATGWLNFLRWAEGTGVTVYWRSNILGAIAFIAIGAVPLLIGLPTLAMLNRHQKPEGDPV